MSCNLAAALVLAMASAAQAAQPADGPQMRADVRLDLLGPAPEPGTEPWDATLYDPKPADTADRANELRLPMPCGGAMVFRRIPVGGSGGALGEQQVELGNADDTDAPLNRQRTAHVAGPFPGGHYYLGKYEVTALQYDSLDDPCPDRAMEHRPAVGISWYDAVDFTRRYTEWLYDNARDALPEADGVAAFVRLPTEVEWEYAARGGAAVDKADFRQAVYPMPGGRIAEHAWIRETVSSSFEPRPVGALAPNPLGLYDILGNVTELVFDLYRLNMPGHLHAQAGGFVVKGGHYRSWRTSVSSAWRQEHPHFNPVSGRPTRLDTVGFRLALSVPVLRSAQRIKAIRQAWSQVPLEVGPSADTGKCHDLAVEVRASLSTVESSLAQCLADRPSAPLAAFPEPPPSHPAPPARLPPWSRVRYMLEHMATDDIRRHGLWYLEAKDPNKALLLFKKAARMGDAWSALAVGAFYDPRLFDAADFDPKQTPFKRPNPTTAHCWYGLAKQLGEPEADRRLEDLAQRQQQPASPNCAAITGHRGPSSPPDLSDKSDIAH